MKIDPSAPSATSPARPAKPGAAAATAANASGSTKDSTVQLSAQVHAMPGPPDGEFDAARVAAIREDIRAGRYQVDPERIASGLLDSVRSLLGPEKPE